MHQKKSSENWWSQSQTVFIYVNCLCSQKYVAWFLQSVTYFPFQWLRKIEKVHLFPFYMKETDTERAKLKMYLNSYFLFKSSYSSIFGDVAIKFKSETQSTHFHIIMAKNQFIWFYAGCWEELLTIMTKALWEPFESHPPPVEHFWWICKNCSLFALRYSTPFTTLSIWWFSLTWRKMKGVSPKHWSYCWQNSPFRDSVLKSRVMLNALGFIPRNKLNSCRQISPGSISINQTIAIS